jgi:hypothetical protein
MPEIKQINTKTTTSFLGSLITSVAEYFDLALTIVTNGGLNQNLQADPIVMNGGLDNTLQADPIVVNGGLDNV